MSSFYHFEGLMNFERKKTVQLIINILNGHNFETVTENNLKFEAF